MHFKFTAENGLLNYWKDHKSILNFMWKPYNWKTYIWACDQLKANNWSAENFKKTCDFNELAPEPTIPSCDTGQRIHFFDTDQLTITWMSIIRLTQVTSSHTS